MWAAQVMHKRILLIPTAKKMRAGYVFIYCCNIFSANGAYTSRYEQTPITAMYTTPTRESEPRPTPAFTYG